MEVIDLSRQILNGTKGHVDVSITPLRRFGDAVDEFDAPCEGFEARLLVMSDHTGTHLDAPNHFIRGGDTVGDIALKRLIGPAVVCDLSDGVRDEITGDEMRSAIKEADDRLGPSDAILLKTTRSSEGGRGISQDAAEVLSGRDTSLVGTDHFGIDNTSQRGRPGHMTLLGAGIPIVEGLVNLQRVVGRRVLFVALPLNIESGTGSPVRAVAVAPFPESSPRTWDLRSGAAA